MYFSLFDKCITIDLNDDNEQINKFIIKLNQFKF